MNKEEILYKVLEENYELKQQLKDEKESSLRWYTNCTEKEEECARLRLQLNGGDVKLSGVLGKDKE